MTAENKYLVPLDSLKRDIAQLVEPVSKIAVTDFPSAQHGVDAAKQVKDLLKRVETTRKSLVAPLNEQVKAINEFAKGIMQPLEAAEAHVKTQLLAFDREQEKLREIERKRIETERLKREAEILAEAEAKQAALEKEQAEVASIFGVDPETQAKAVEAIAEETTIALAVHKSDVKAKEFDVAQMGVKNVRKIWKCELIDINAVPREFLTITLNEKAVLAMARAGQTNIPGVRVYQESSVAIGANTYVPTAALRSGR